MYLKKLLLILFLGFSLTTFSQSLKQEDALKKMIESEKAFAQTSIDKGTKNAFLTFLGLDAVVFENGMPINGLEKWHKTNDLKEVFTWQPSLAEIATDSDLGYTTGSWQIHPKNAKEKAIAFGSFITIWKKQTDSTWKVVADIGVNHKELLEDKSSILKNYPIFKPSELKNNATFVFMNDHFYWKNAKTSPNPFEPHLAQNVRIYRNGQFPIIGKEAANSFLKKSFDKTLIYTGLQTITSTSGDLACVYGTISGNKTGSYLRIWRQEAKGVWKIAVEVVSI
jgi:ketosteroid isomerase-like protein